eukprot:8920012-Ditylum_brightwellii.AAC.1
MILVLGLGLSLGSDTVFILSSKLSIQSGYVLGLGYSLGFGHGVYIRFKAKHLIWICSWFEIRSRFRHEFSHQVQSKELDWDLILAWDVVLVQT